MAGPLHKLQHVKGLAGEELAVVRRLPQHGHEVVKVALLHSQHPGHPEDVVLPDLGLSVAVVVAHGDGRKVHDGDVHFVQDGDVGILVELDHAARHLVQEAGKRGAERRRPQEPAERDPAGQEDVAEAMEGAVGTEHGDVRRRALFFLLGSSHSLSCNGQ